MGWGWGWMWASVWVMSSGLVLVFVSVLCGLAHVFGFGLNVTPVSRYSPELWEQASEYLQGLTEDETVSVDEQLLNNGPIPSFPIPPFTRHHMQYQAYAKYK